MRWRVLLTCPPMLRSIARFEDAFRRAEMIVTAPPVVQTLTEQQLIALIPEFDGWIIGDDPATRQVFAAGRAGRLRAAVKWGVGIDNVDFAACRDLKIHIANTPGAFGPEVADVAMGYIIALARETFAIDRGVRGGQWPKPAGISLAGRTVALVGFGDIGRNTARRLLTSEMNVIAYDPFYKPASGMEAVRCLPWPQGLGEADFIVFTCALTPQNRHMFNEETIAHTKPGVRVVNVARGPLIEEAALARALKVGRVHSAALDVFETEPLPELSPLRQLPQCVFGSHNSSNTIDAVVRTSGRALDLLKGFFELGAEQ